MCNCKEGFIIDPRSDSCTFLFIHATFVIIDINECSERFSSCNQWCVNTIGSYDCDCYTGFDLKSDNKTCLGIEY